MREIEVKFLEVDPDGVISSLERLGAERIFEGEITADYFDFDDKRLAKQDITIRLRRKGASAELTLKKKKKNNHVKI